MTELDADATVFVVDDDRELADTYAIWVEQEGYETMTAYGGDEALQQLNPEVDVMLLDRRMPDIPGDVVLNEARSRDGEYQISMLTAVEPKEGILELPFDEYLSKPVTKSEVVGVVTRLVIRDGLDDDLSELFRLTTKLNTLESTDADGQAIQQLEEKIEAKEAALQDKLQHIDDPEGAYAAVKDSD